MYNHTIDKLVGTGLAVKLDEHVWMDLDGDTCTEEEAFRVESAPYDSQTLLVLLWRQS